jgi:zinc protease
MIRLKKMVYFAALFIFFSCGTENSKELIQEVVKKGDEIVIPFKKFVLNNGLTLIVHEDHSDPVVHIDVTYHVGSAREEIGKSGFAHFFEHMMFEGSKHVEDGEHFKIITESGGALNGTTNRDRTNYFETLPANQLEVGIWLESDRMGFLLEAVTQEKFEIQRSTVKNERGQNYDNRPYGLVQEEVAKNIYSYGHPYSWLTIGYVEDLDRVDVEDLKRFFTRWYGPNNAVISIGGDVNSDEVLALVKKYFGPIPKGPDVANMPKMIPALREDRYIAGEDKIRLPLLQLVFPTMPRFDEEEYSLDCFADILGYGPTSILHKNLIKTQKAVNTYAYNSTSELSGEFIIGAVSKPGTGLDSIEKVIRESFLEFEKKGVSQEDVDKFVAQRKSGAIYGLATVEGKVSQLSNFQTFTGDANYIARDLQLYDDLTPEKVMAAYQKYIKGKACLILSWVPEGELNLAAASNNYSIDSSRYQAGPDEYSNLESRTIEDGFDRASRPPSGPNPVVHVPDFWTEEFDNGLKIIASESNELPTVNISLFIPGGNRLLGNSIEKLGLARLMGSLMNESTENFTAEEIAQKLELLGSSVNVRSGINTVTVNIQSLEENLDETLELAEEIIFRPAFNEEDFDRLKNQQLQSVKNRETQASSIASVSFSKLLYGKDNIAGNPVSGWEETVVSIGRKDVKDFYKKVFTPKNANLVIVGDVEKEKVLAQLGFFKTWTGEDQSIPGNGPLPELSSTKIYLIDKAGAAQSEIRIGYITGLIYEPLGEYYRNILMNFPLGGNFNSRINLNLREEKGYTYGARSFFSSDDFGGFFLASSGVKKEATADAIKEFMKEIGDYGSYGITDEELAFLKNSIGQREALKYESPFQKARFLRRILRYNLPADYTDRQNEILQGISKEEIDAAAKKWLNPDKMSILVVGDSEQILTQLESLGFEIVRLDLLGNPL